MATATITGRVLVLSSDDEPLDEVEAQLLAGGYELHRCVAAGAASFPCIGLGGGACPLDEPGGVDVAVDVRHHPWPNPTSREMGVTCAVRAGVPVAILGRSPHPFTAWANVTSTELHRVVEVCEDAVADGLEGPRAAVAEAVDAVLETHGLGGTPFAVHLERRLGRLHVRITADVPGTVAAMAAARAAVAARRFDRSATSLEIDVATPATARQR